MMEILWKFLAEVGISYTADQLAKLIDMIVSGLEDGGLDVDSLNLPPEIVEVLMNLNAEEMQHFVEMVGDHKS